MAQKQAWIDDDNSIHDERFKRFYKVFLAARFPRITDNTTPRCMLFKWSDNLCLFSNSTNTLPIELNQVKLHNYIKPYPFKNELAINLSNYNFFDAWTIFLITNYIENISWM